MIIGNIDLGEQPLLLAPMEDVTDLSFRLLCKKFGADLVYSEFLSADALIRSIPGTLNKMRINETERPTALQIYGRDPETMAEAAIRCMEAEPDILDLNFGCPVKRVAHKGAGSGMLRTPELLLEIVERVVKAVPIPVTVKTRLGWDESSKIIVELAEKIQDKGAQALTIHGRTRAQMYTGEADWSLIGKVKENPRMTIPIIGNGDITTGEDVVSAFRRYGVDGVMVGRAAIGKPWIFEDMKYYMQHGRDLEKRPTDFYISVLKVQVDSNIAKIDEYRGILHSRRHIATNPIFKGIDNFKPMRVAMLRATTRSELFGLIDEAAVLIKEQRGI